MDADLDHQALLDLSGGARALATPHSTAALFLHLWERRGPSLFAELEGDFALAIDDRPNRRLILARDCLGQRPLFHRVLGRTVHYASHARSLAALHCEASADDQSLVDFLSWLPEQGPRSFLAGVERVEPGCFVEFGASGLVRRRRWWTPSLTPVSMSFDDAAQVVGSEIERATAHALGPRNVVAAAQLSGGLDSSIVVTAASRLLRGGERRLFAVTADLSKDSEMVDHDCFADEGAIAAATVANLENIDHQIVSIASPSPFAMLDRWIGTSDRPLRNACNLGWLDATFAAARDAGATRLLIGSAGNHGVSEPGSGLIAELAGSFRWGQLAREIPYLRAGGASALGILTMIIGPYLPLPVWNRVRPGRGAMTSDVAIANSLLRDDHPLVRLARAKALSTGSGADTRPPRGNDPAERLAHIGAEDYGVHHAAIRARFGLTQYDPLGARRVLELILRLTPEHFFRNGKGRQLARTILDHWTTTPASSITGRGYQGGNWREGFERDRGEMRREIATIDRNPRLRLLFDTKSMTRMVDEWPTDGWHRTDQMVLYRSHLMPALSTSRWVRAVEGIAMVDTL